MGSFQIPIIKEKPAANHEAGGDQTAKESKSLETTVVPTGVNVQHNATRPTFPLPSVRIYREDTCCGISKRVWLRAFGVFILLFSTAGLIYCGIGLVKRQIFLHRTLGSSMVKLHHIHGGGGNVTFFHPHFYRYYMGKKYLTHASSDHCIHRRHDNVRGSDIIHDLRNHMSTLIDHGGKKCLLFKHNTRDANKCCPAYPWKLEKKMGVITCPPPRFLRHGYSYFTTVSRLVNKTAAGVTVPYECEKYKSYQVAAVMVIYHRRRLNLRFTRKVQRNRRDLLEPSSPPKELETPISDVDQSRINKKLNQDKSPKSNDITNKNDKNDKESEKTLSKSESGDQEKELPSKVGSELKKEVHQGKSLVSQPTKSEHNNLLKIRIIPSILAKINDIHTETYTWKNAYRISKLYKQWITSQKAKLLASLLH